ncbi:beta strand repeat-containing protein [Malaciobacter mytili]|uniref:beta strand repeat-containing protein n=1 Tax=Malaciobacter mytili TaxID=603050 RepID=UPI003A846BF9
MNGPTLTVTIDGTNPISVSDGTNSDTLTNIESIKTSNGNDNFIVSSTSNLDTLDAGSGTDTLTLSGDLDLSNVTLLSSLNVTLDASGNATINLAGTDSLTSIEGFYGTSSNDSITGNAQINVFEGRAGDDILTGNGGDDTLDGGSGNDTIYAGSGNDKVIGGTGEDWIDYSVSDLGVNTSSNVNLRAQTSSGDNGDDVISQIEHVKVGNGTNTIEGNSLNNSLIGGTGTDTLSYSGAAASVTVDIANGTATGDGNDTFANFEKYIGSSQADIFKNDSIDNINIDGRNSNDLVDYSTATSATLTVTIDGTNPISVSDGTNSDTLTNIESIKTSNGNDNFIVSSTSNLDTLDAGSGTDTLTLSGDLDLSNVTLLNFEKIIVQDGDTLTLNAVDLDNKTMNIELQGSANLIVEATSNANEHDFANITVTKNSGKVTLDVKQSVDLSSKNLGNNTLFDTFTIGTTATLILSEAQAISKVVNGSGNVVIEVNSNSSTDFSSILTLDNSANETVEFSSNTTFTGNLADSKANIVSGAILNIDASRVTSKEVIGNGALNITNLDATPNADFSNIASSLNVNASTASSVTYTGNLDNVDTLTIGNGTVFTTDASIISSKIVNGSGTLNVTNLDLMLNANFTNVNPTTLNVEWSSSSALTYTGNLSNVDNLTISSGTMNVDALILNSATVITNSAALNINNLEAVSSMDLTKVSGNSANVDWSGTATFTGNLGTSNLIVSSGTMSVSDSATINNANSIIVNGTLQANASLLNGDTISGSGVLIVNNLDSATTMDFSNLTVNTINVDWSGTATYTGNLTNVDKLNISSGTLSLDDSILGTTTVTGNGNLVVNANDSSLDLSNVSSTLGVVTINDSASNVNIQGSAGDDILNLNGGDDTANLANGNDSVNIDIANLSNADSIDGSIGSDSFNFTTSGTIDSDAFSNIVNFETLNFSNGNDVILFDDITDFTNFNNKFTTINDLGGNDTINFGSISITGDLDFSKLDDFETLNLSSSDDDISISGDEPTNINGEGGNDTFALDFNNIGSFNLDGGANSDKVKVSGNGISITNDLDNLFGGAENFTNIEHLDITSLNGGAAFSSDVEKEFEITASMVEEWLGSTNGNLKLSLTKAQAENLSFTTSDSQEHNTSVSGSANSIDNGGVYNLDADTTLTIDLIDA